MSFPRYAEYKDSSIEWLGEVPAHWEVEDLKYRCEIIPSNVDKKSHSDELPVQLCNYTDVYYNARITSQLTFMRATARKAEIDKFQLEPDDVVITKDSETADDIAVPAIVTGELPGVLCGYHLAILRARELASGRFVNYLFQSHSLRYYFEITARGLTRVGLSQSAIGNSEIAWPEVNEQRRIAAFLDHETARIDALIEEQQRLIELLKEKRQAVISHAVTKGLDPGVPMKDSGVEWLGDVPAHWELLPAKRIFRLVAEPSPPSNDYELLSVYTEIGVRPRRELEQRGNKASTTDGYWKVERGDLIVNKLLAWMGAVGYSDYEGVTSPAYDILRPNEKAKSKFYHYLFRSRIASFEFKRWSRGIMEMRLRLYFDELGRILVPVPPIQNQEKIIHFLDCHDMATEELISKSLESISLLRERRSALISAAVTGKIDVRNWQVPSESGTETYSIAAEAEAAYEASRS